MLEPIPFVWPLAGGLLVGLSAGLYLLLNGRVAGISGLTAAATGLSKGAPRTLGLLFIAGLLGGAALASALIRRPEVQITSDIWLLVLGGLIVGFGTRWGSGCTSGHGVCGLAHRGYTAGFLQRRPAQDLQNYATGSSQPVRSLFVGEVVACGDGWAEVETKNRFAVGDRLEIIHPAGNRTVRLEGMQAAATGEPLQVASGSPLRVRIPLEGPAEGAMLARLLEGATA